MFALACAPQMTTSGDNNAAGDQVIIVTIDNDYQTPNTFKWNVDGGAYTTGVAIPSGLSVTLQEDIVVTFTSQTGYTIGQTWTLAASNAASALTASPTQVCVAQCWTVYAGCCTGANVRRLRWLVRVLAQGA